MSLSPLHILTMGITISLFSNFASNLWNHTNDLTEDRLQGKKTVLTLNIVSHKTAICLSMLLYAISAILAFYASIKFEKPIYLFFLVGAVISWWYSDKVFLRRLFGFRLKTHYIGELVTYGIAYPSYALTIWLIYSDLNTSGIALALAFSFFGISGVLLKDLKDISGDRQAGLKTLGVKFTSSKLLYISCLFLILYYIVILDSIVLKVFSAGMLLVIIPFIWFIKNTFYYFHRKGWKLEFKDYRSIKTMMISTYLSLIVLGIGAFI